jgi:hypothetical protein
MKFTAYIRSYYFKNSKGKDANLFNGMRLVECMLHKDTRAALIRFRSQIGRAELDAANSSEKPKGFTKVVADLYNDDEVELQSRTFEEAYGAPFDVVRALVPPAKKMQATHVKDFINHAKRPISITYQKIVASGKGEEHYLKKYIKNAHKDENGRVLANTDIIGYVYARFEEEDLLHLLIQNMTANGANMNQVNNIPLNLEEDSNNDDDGTAKKRRYNKSASSKKKSNASPGAKNVALRMLDYMKSSDEAAKLNEKRRYLLDKQALLAGEETRIISLEDRLQQAQGFVFTVRRELRSEGMETDAIKESEEYLNAFAAVDICKARLHEMNEQISASKLEIEKLKAEVLQMEEDADLAVPTALGYGSGDDNNMDTPGPSKAYAKFTAQKEFDTASNNGSDDELDADYQVVDMDDDDGNDEEDDGVVVDENAWVRFGDE